LCEEARHRKHRTQDTQSIEVKRWPCLYPTRVSAAAGLSERAGMLRLHSSLYCLVTTVDEEDAEDEEVEEVEEDEVAGRFLRRCWLCGMPRCTAR
jgi:hypothetical protein